MSELCGIDNYEECKKCISNCSCAEYLGFVSGYKKFYEEINDYLDTHETNERLIRAQLTTILNNIN